MALDSEQLRKIPPAVRPTVQAARHTVKAIAPKAKEIAYRSQPPRSSRAMWKLVGEGGFGPPIIPRATLGRSRIALPKHYAFKLVIASSTSPTSWTKCASRLVDRSR